MSQALDGTGEDRHRAIRLAREGRYDEALAILRPLYRDDPRDLALRADLVVVLSWAGEDEEALELGETMPVRELEPIVVEGVARSARNVGRPTLAARLYGDVVRRHEDRVESQIGYALALAEAGSTAQAEARVPVLLERFGDDADVRVAAGHVLRAAERPLEAAVQYRRALELSPDGAEPFRDEALRHEVRSLESAGAVHRAVERMEEAPELFDDGERARVLAARSARAVAWASEAVWRPRPGQRFGPVDEALARIDSVLAVVHPEVGFPWYQLRFDRVVGLVSRHRMEEALQEVRALDAEGVELPPYVQLAGADAARALRESDEAERRYRVALEEWPANPEIRIGLFHALVQQNRYDEAHEVLEPLLEGEPEYRWSGDGERLPNPTRLTAALTHQTGQAFAGRLGEAQEAFESLRGRAPMNLSVRQELASVYLFRGWPRRALVGYERILHLDPEHVGARVGAVSALLAVDERRRARAIADTLLTMAPEDRHVRRVARDVRADGLWELSVDARGGRSTGGELGTRDRAARSRLLTPPVADRLRLFAAVERRDADFADGRGLHDRVAGGLEVRSRPVRLTLEVSGDRDGERRIGGAGRLEVRPGDRLSFHLDGSSHSLEVPLQATLQAVDGWRAAAGLAYRPHERRWWMAEGAVVKMSDGNRRTSLYSGVEQELVGRPGGRLAGILELYGALNSREDAPYFNPQRIVSPATALRWEWTLWRSFERRLVQETGARMGAVRQEGFSTDPVLDLEYGHRWETTHRFELHYGVRWGRPVYDGDRERRWGFAGGLTWGLP